MPPVRKFEDALVTIVIPCFNHAHYLNETIQSALALRHPRTEIIVVDDGSTDNSADVALSYQEVVYIYQTNQDVGAARNTGIRNSTGEFIIFLDSDDRLRPNAIEDGLACFERYPESGMVFGRYQKIDTAGNVISDPTFPSDEVDFYTAMLQRNPIGHPAIGLHRKEVLQEIGGFDTSFHGSSDYHLYLRIAQRYTVHKHDGVVSEYRWHDANASWNYRYMLENTIRVLQTQRDFARQTPVRKTALKKGLTNWRNHYGQLMLIAFEDHWKAHGLDRGSLARLRDVAYYYPAGLGSLTKSALGRLSPRA